MLVAGPIFRGLSVCEVLGGDGAFFCLGTMGIKCCFGLFKGIKAARRRIHRVILIVIAVLDIILAVGVNTLQHLHGPDVVAVAHQEPQGFFHSPHHVQVPHLQESVPQGPCALAGGAANLPDQLLNAALTVLYLVLLPLHGLCPPTVNS